MDVPIPAPERTIDTSRRLAGLPDDRLGTLAMVAVVSELVWTPDVGPAVIDRLERDAVAYPEHFARMPHWGAPDAVAVTGSRRRRMSYAVPFLVVLIAAIIGIFFLVQGAAAFAGFVAGS